jgi:hypothetical protein
MDPPANNGRTQNGAGVGSGFRITPPEAIHTYTVGGPGAGTQGVITWKHELLVVLFSGQWAA